MLLKNPSWHTLFFALLYMIMNTSLLVSAPQQSFSLTERLESVATTEQSIIILLLISFCMGILMSLTPCIYPMIPITIGIMRSNLAPSLIRNFLTASAYVSGLSVVYATLGYLAATTSLMFGQWMNNHFLIFGMSIFLLYLAGSLFGWYELYTPSFLQKTRTIQMNGSLVRVFIFGMLAGTIASPCLTPGLAALLTVAAKLGNPILGFLLLFFFSLGMGLLLIIIGTFSNTLSMLPRAGIWMQQGKRIMGFLMLGMIIYLYEPMIGSNVTIIGYIALTGIFVLTSFLSYFNFSKK